MRRLLNILDVPKNKFRKISMPLFMLFVSSAAQASCAKLAKIAGIKQKALNQIIEKLVTIETTTGKYTVKNYHSGAYGRYQIMPSTARFYAQKLGIPEKLWKKPYNQDKIFKAIMKDNIRSLKHYGHEISAFSIYATHQQGVVGFNTIMKGRKITKILEKRLRQNLPKKLGKVKKSKLRTTWINYWKNRLS